MKISTILYLLLLASCANAQEKKTKQHIAVCQRGNGCEIIEMKSTSLEMDKALGKTGFWVNVSDSATLVIENCTSKIVERLSLSKIHQSYGGKGEPKLISRFDIQKYLKEKGSLSSCANTTKKISFYCSADDFSGSGYFFLNLKASEAFLPNEGFQQFYGSEAKGMIIDQFIRNGAMESYTIAEGQKFHTQMPIDANISAIKNDALNEQRFKTDFKKSGNTRKHLNTTEIETEYTGKDDERKAMSFWVTPVNNVCLPKGKFDVWGFYNLGYISVDGTTYLVTEISGNGFQVKLTGISEGAYNFNPVGYKSVGR